MEDVEVVVSVCMFWETRALRFSFVTNFRERKNVFIDGIIQETSIYIDDAYLVVVLTFTLHVISILVLKLGKNIILHKK